MGLFSILSKKEKKLDKQEQQTGGEQTNSIELPKEYLDFMLEHNGGEGDIGTTWFVLYPLEELEKINEEYKIREILPDSIIIGSNGASELYGIDSNGEYFNVPEIIEKKYVTKLGKNFNKLPHRINQIWK